MRQIIDSRWFALFNLFLVLGCGAIWMIEPQAGKWLILIALLPWGLRIVTGQFPFKRTPLDWLIVIFFVTTWVGYWASYDKTAAWNKVWLIMTAILFYYALVSQPKENWNEISILFYCIGVGVSGYFFLTHDFIAAPRKLGFVNHIGTWLMGFRPYTGWIPIHPNYVAGIAAITAPFILHPLQKVKGGMSRKKIPFYIFAMIGSVIIFFAFIMATSRGAVMAVVSGLGVWLLWKFIHLYGIRNRIELDAFFPLIVLFFLCVIVVFLYVGPANSGSISSGNYYYGDGSREELLSRSLYLLEDYPFTGGGLRAFPGLYSQYLLNIPFFNVPNSHNTFLDVAIGLGFLGGLSFLLMYLVSIWHVSRSLTREKSPKTRLIKWIILFSLIVAVVHGMVDDYLFYRNGTILSLFLVALSVLVTQDKDFTIPVISKLHPRIAGIGIIIIVFSLVAFSKNIIAAWYANMGSVLMSQVELDGFPNNGWVGTSIVSDLTDAETALHTSLQFAPNNRTANQRLGMISMLRQDFASASEYLETAYKVTPNNRGIVKSLGYCYVWTGDLNKAEEFLSRIPEAQEELDVYIWWWNTQGRSDLSNNAAMELQILKNTSN